MAAKRKPPENPGIPEWVLTYGDLMSLLLCFFILLAAFSELKKPREYIRVIDSIQEAFGFQGGQGISAMNPQFKQRLNRAQGRMSSQSANEQEARNETTDDNITGETPQVSFVEEGKRWVLGGSIAFSPGSTELEEQGKKMLADEVAPQIRGQHYICVVVGHAWGIEDKTSGLSFNDLAYQRAREVRDFLVRECEVEEAILRVEVAGAAEPKSIDLSQLDGGSVNRRVQVYKTGRTVENVVSGVSTGRAGAP